MTDISVNIAGVTFKNPVMTASGTFGSGMEYSEFVDLSRLGAVVTKGVSLTPWPGNPTPRVAETYGGMLNAIGLQNPGIDTFIERDLKFLEDFDTKVIVNVCGKTIEEYLGVVERLSDTNADMLEINVSCPNVREGAIAFGQNPEALSKITKEIKKKAKQPVIMKLSPNVTDIALMAKVCEDGGADGEQEPAGPPVVHPLDVLLLDHQHRADEYEHYSDRSRDRQGFAEEHYGQQYAQDGAGFIHWHDLVHVADLQRFEIA